MPAMTMVFRAKDPAMLAGLKPGDKVKFEAQKLGGCLYRDADRAGEVRFDPAQMPGSGRVSQDRPRREYDRRHGQAAHPRPSRSAHAGLAVVHARGACGGGLRLVAGRPGAGDQRQFEPAALPRGASGQCKSLPRALSECGPKRGCPTGCRSRLDRFPAHYGRRGLPLDRACGRPSLRAAAAFCAAAPHSLSVLPDLILRAS